MIFILIIKDFEKLRIKCAIVGGIAMAFHDQPRFTKDIDILALPEDLEIIKKAFEELGYFESSQP